MKTKYLRFLLLILTVIIFLSINSCKKDDGPTSPNTPTEKIQLGSNTKQIEQTPTFTSVAVDSTQLKFNFSSSSTLPTIKVGDILIGKNGGGYLRKATFVSTQGNSIIVLTTGAPIDEAFTKFKIDTSFTLSTSVQKIGALNTESTIDNNGKKHLLKVTSNEPTMSVDNQTGDISLSFPNMKFEAKAISGIVEFELKAELVKIGIGISTSKFIVDIDGKLNSFALIYRITKTVEFKNVSTKFLANATIEKEIDLLGNDIPFFAIPIGPLVFNFGFNISAGIKAEAKVGFNTDYTTSTTSVTTLEVGAEYKNNTWNTVWEKNSTGNSDVSGNPALGASFTSKLYLKPKVNVKLYGVVGPKLFVSGFVYGDIKPEFPPKLAIGLGVNGGIGFEMKIFTWKVFSFEYLLAEVKWPIWEKTFGNSPPTLPTNPSPTNNSINQPISSQLSWSCTDPDNDPLTYDVWFGTSAVALVASNQTSTSYNPGTLINNTKYYWMIVAKDNKGGLTQGGGWNFTTIAAGTAPQPPTLSSPSNNATGQSITPTLSWNPSTGATSYIVQVSKGDNSFSGSALIVNENVGNNLSKQLSGLVNNTTYYWRVSAANSYGTSNPSTTWSFTTATAATAPTVTTNSITGITSTTATGGGNVTAQGSASVTQRGVCWSTSQNPTTANSKTVDGSGTGSFTSAITPLTVSTTYYVRAYATNSAGTSYGSQVSFTTVSGTTMGVPCPGTPTVSYAGKTYNTVQIGTQCWLKENLDVGTMIQGSQNPSNNGIIEKYCYDNKTENCNIYGGLYQWNEAMQYVTTERTKGICPSGWHLPIKAEFETLAAFVNNDGNTLKEKTQIYEYAAGTNTTGFSALLSGWREGATNAWQSIGTFTAFWSTSSIVGQYNHMTLWYDNRISFLSPYLNDGHSVRCLKD